MLRHTVFNNAELFIENVIKIDTIHDKNLLLSEDGKLITSSI